MAKLPTGLSDLEMGTSAYSNEPYDWRYCRYLANEYRVVGIPASSFFSVNSESAAKIGPTARFAFCKKDETLIEASRRLMKKS